LVLQNDKTIRTYMNFGICRVWHKYFGHARWRLITKLSKLKLVKGLPDLNYNSNSLCKACQKGKIV